MARHSPVEVVAGAAVLLAAAGFLVFAAANTGHGAASGYTLHAAFDHADGLSTGADVRIAGVKIGAVQSIALNDKTYQAEVGFTVRNGVVLTTDSSATISTDGLLGGKYLALATGGEEKTLHDGGTITVTEGSVNLEALIGKYIFGGVGNKGAGAQGAAQPGPNQQAPGHDGGATPPLK